MPTLRYRDPSRKEKPELPPHDDAAEAGALACVLSNDPEASDRLDKLCLDDFYDERCRQVYRALRCLADDFGQTDPVSLLQWLKDKGELANAGGDAFIAQLPDATPSPEQFPVFLETVRDRATRRRIIHQAADLQSKAFNVAVPIESLEAFEIETVHRVESPIPWSELNKPVNYENNLLGDRYFERGQGLILYGPSGSGKSVAATQAEVEWSAGLAGLHIKPTRPLKIIVLQTEDSMDDQRETLAGIKSSSALTPEHIRLVEQNLIIFPPISGGDPQKLVDEMERKLRQHKPDIISVNPLLAFCPGDPARELGGILYQYVDPVIKKYSVGFVGVHHTPKMNNKDTSGYGMHDHQYLAAGDARVANWPRAMVMIEEVKYPVYRFRLTKRGHRAGWTWEQKPTNERYFRHHDSEIRWVDAMPEDIKAAASAADYRTITQVLPKHDQPAVSRERIRNEAKSRFNAGINKADQWLKLAIEDGLVEVLDSVNENRRKVALFRLKKEAK